jgi:hypothetical protein
MIYRLTSILLLFLAFLANYSFSLKTNKVQSTKMDRNWNMYGERRPKRQKMTEEEREQFFADEWAAQQQQAADDYNARLADQFPPQGEPLW